MIERHQLMNAMFMTIARLARGCEHLSLYAQASEAGERAHLGWDGACELVVV